MEGPDRMQQAIEELRSSLLKEVTISESASGNFPDWSVLISRMDADTLNQKIERLMATTYYKLMS